jgi:hypothetical protein
MLAHCHSRALRLAGASREPRSFQLSTCGGIPQILFAINFFIVENITGARARQVTVVMQAGMGEIPQ